MINTPSLFNFLSQLPDFGDGHGAMVGPFRVYQITFFFAILLAFGLSWIQFKRRNLPMASVEWSLFIVLIPGIIGARIWDIAYRPQSIHSFMDVIAVWKGGLAVQGGIVGGGIAGWFWFRHFSKKYKISIWLFADCIIPNILLAQALGRWGNFFNQEILGHQVSEASLSWIIPGIRNYLHYPGEDCFRQPLFLYESIANCGGWFFMVFILPKIGFLFSHKKPWKINPRLKDDLSAEFYEIDRKISNRQSLILMRPMLKIWAWFKWKHKCWKDAFYLYEPDPTVIKELRLSKPKIPKIMPYFTNKHLVTIEMFIKLSFWKTVYYFKRNSKPLENLYNPNHYNVTRVGLSCCSYFVIYGFVRIILDNFKSNGGDGTQPDPYSGGGMVVNGVDLALVISIIFIAVGIIMIFLLQYYYPFHLRKKGWFYERQY